MKRWKWGKKGIVEEVLVFPLHVGVQSFAAVADCRHYRVHYYKPLYKNEEICLE